MKAIIIIAIFFNSSLFGQIKDAYIPQYGNGDTTLWYKWKMNEIKQMGLENLLNSKDSLHFRFWTETSAIDIRTSDFKTFKGVLCYFATSANATALNTTNRKPDKYYSKKIPLKSLIAKRIYKLFDSLLIFSIPTGDSIKGWGGGNDGETFIIEYSTGEKYSFKEYWTPSLFREKVSEAKNMNMLVHELSKIKLSRDSWFDYLNTLPEGYYRAGGMMVTYNRRFGRSDLNYAPKRSKSKR
jgi:hypothetical protein